MKRTPEEVRRNPKRSCRRAVSISSDHALGLLATIPQEMVQLVLRHSTPQSLTALALTSKSMCFYLRNLAVDSNLFIHPLSQWITDKSMTSIKRQFRDIGNFLRCTSAYLSLADKQDVMESFLYQLEKTYHRICEEIGLRFAYDCIGVMFYRFIDNWDDSSLVKGFILIERLSRLKERVQKVLINDPGISNLQHYERDVRQFIRQVFLNKSVSRDQHALWLQQVLIMFPESQHSRLIYLLYGPVESHKSTGMVDWDMMCCCSSYHTGCPYTHFRDLADAIKLMAGSTLFGWSESKIIDFFHQLTVMPDKWCLENCAKLMFLVGKDFTVKVLKTKLLKEEVQEFSHIAYHLAQVSSEQSKESSPDSLGWFIDIMVDCLSVYGIRHSKKSYVIGEVFTAWTDNIQALTEVLEDPLEDEDVRDDIRSSYTNLAAMTHMLFTRLYLDNKHNILPYGDRKPGIPLPVLPRNEE